MKYFSAKEVAAVRVCFGSLLPDLIVERILELRIERCWGIDSDGRRRLEFYKDGVRHGQWETWFANRQRSCVENFRHGKRNGKKTTWYENGSKRSEQNFIEWQQYGLQIMWYSNGEIMHKYSFHDGKFVNYLRH